MSNKKIFTGFIAILFAVLLFLPFGQAKALSGSQFNAGRIIDDGVFFAPGLMTVSQIQLFLDSKVPTCDTNGSQIYSGTTTRSQYGTSKGYPAPYTCLKDYSMSEPSRAADQYCTGNVAGGTRTAAQVIYDVSLACNVNPMVLLVTLQKEQSLVTDDWPWPTQYDKALGYACPDTAPCSPEYAGLFNQLYYSARQFRRYAQQPTLFNFRGGQTSNVLFNPNTGCGSSAVNIQTQATAGLYNYTPYQPNAAALSNLYGTGDGCSAYGNRNFWRLFNDWFGSTYNQATVLSFKSHVSNIGWGDLSLNGGITGTVGQNLPMEAFKLNGEVEYSSYNYTTDWQPTVNRGIISGTVGQNRAIEAIKINPLTTLASQYDIFYRVHVSDIGWMDWTKNGQPAGVTGDAVKHIEAFEVKLLAKGSAAPGDTTTPYINSGVATYNPPLSLAISSHVAGYGWQPEVTDGMTTGTTEQARHMEAIKIALNNTTGQAGDIDYSVHAAGIGWMDIKTSNVIAGTTGQNRQLEALRMTLTGTLGANYDIWYRAHVGTRGWTDWAKNGQPAGSVGAGLELEAVETRLVPKDSITLPAQNRLYNPKGMALPDNYSVLYAVHVSSIGWMYNIPQNINAGTTGQAKSMEALNFSPTNSFLGPITITCSAYSRGLGWSSTINPGSTCGTTGQNRPLESVKLSLSGPTASNYDIYYGVHVAQLGWQPWTTNGAAAGTPGSGKSIEAIIIKLVQK